MNFFGDKHGKNGRDAHFSNISRFIVSESLTRKLYCSQDIVDSIFKRQLLSNENNKSLIFFEQKTKKKGKAFFKFTILNCEKLGTSKQITFAFSLNPDIDAKYKEKYQIHKTLTIQNLESFYNYRTIDQDFKLVTSV